MTVLKTPRVRAYLGLALLAAGLVGLAVSGDLRAHSALFVSFYVLAGAGFAVLATAATSLPLRGAIVAAVVLRLIFLPAMPSLSDDYHRYVWDGRVQLAGINPYKYRPYEHALDRVPYAGRDLINHDELKTIYPPLTQAVFAGVEAATRALGLDDAATPRADVMLFKLVFGAFDLATAAAVWFLAARKLRLQATVLYLLCPAVIVQTWESAHAEAATVFFCVLAAALLLRRRDGWAGIALGVAAAFKVTPLGLLVPALLGRARLARPLPRRLRTGPRHPLRPLPRHRRLIRLVVPERDRLDGRFSGLHPARPAHLSPARALARARSVHRGSGLDRRQLPWPREHRRGLRLDVHPAVLCLPVVHAWYWLSPLALGLAAGIWLPLLVGMVAPLVESLPLAAWLARARHLTVTGGAVRAEVVLSLHRTLGILRR